MVPKSRRKTWPAFERNLLAGRVVWGDPVIWTAPTPNAYLLLMLLLVLLLL